MGVGRTRNFFSSTLWPRSHISFNEIYYRIIRGDLIMGLGLVWDKVMDQGIDGNHKWLVQLRKECAELREENRELRSKIKAIENNRKLTEQWARGAIEN